MTNRTDAPKRVFLIEKADGRMHTEWTDRPELAAEWAERFRGRVLAFEPCGAAEAKSFESWASGLPVPGSSVLAASSRNDAIDRMPETTIEALRLIATLVPHGSQAYEIAAEHVRRLTSSRPDATLAEENASLRAQIAEMQDRIATWIERGPEPVRSDKATTGHKHCGDLKCTPCNERAEREEAEAEATFQVAERSSTEAEARTVRALDAERYPRVAGCGDPTCKGEHCGEVTCGLLLRGRTSGSETGGDKASPPPDVDANPEYLFSPSATYDGSTVIGRLRKWRNDRAERLRSETAQPWGKCWICGRTLDSTTGGQRSAGGKLECHGVQGSCANRGERAKTCTDDKATDSGPPRESGDGSTSGSGADNAGPSCGCWPTHEPYCHAGGMAEPAEHDASKPGNPVARVIQHIDQQLALDRSSDLTNPHVGRFIGKFREWLGKQPWSDIASGAALRTGDTGKARG